MGNKIKQIQGRNGVASSVMVSIRLEAELEGVLEGSPRQHLWNQISISQYHHAIWIR